MDKLRQMRKAKGWTQKQLAEASGVDRVTISAAENGRRRPHLSNLEKLAVAMGEAKNALYPIEVGPAYFVPVEEGEAPDTVAINIHYVWLFDGDEPILRAIREATPEEKERFAKGSSSS